MTAVSNDTRWGGVFLQKSDIEINESTSAPASEETYIIAQRRNGEMFINRRSGTTVTTLATFSGSTLSLNTDYHYTINVTPTTITLNRVAASMSTTVLETVVATDSTHRPITYFSLGVIAAAIKFKDVVRA
jgi:hypothetical protein